MNAIDLIAAALPPAEPPESPREGLCCVTGRVGPTIDRRHVVLDSFTGLDLLRAPGSDRAGTAAWRVMHYTVLHPDPAKHIALRPLQQSHWLCDGRTLRLLDRRGVRQAVLHPCGAEAWAGYATTSYKKYGALRAPVNAAGRAVWLWETRPVDCSDRDAVADAWARLRAAQNAGIHRPLIESLNIAPGYLAKIGWRTWRDFERWARPRLRAPLYEFLTYLLPSMEELRCGSA